MMVSLVEREEHFWSIRLEMVVLRIAIKEARSIIFLRVGILFLLVLLFWVTLSALVSLAPSFP